MRLMDSGAVGEGQLKILRRRAIIACFAGNLFELYDFVVFGFFAIQIGQAVFSSHDPITSVLASFATYGTGFLTRPIGAMVMGSYGDRRGRKTALSLTITLMALATGLTGFVPTYARAGIWSPVLLVSFRLLQGFSTRKSRNAPSTEPSSVKLISNGSRLRFTSGLRRNGRVPPTLIKVRANILVASAMRGSI